MTNREFILTQVYELLKQLSDSDFQQRVWVEGKGSIQSTYVELLNMLFDDYNFDEIIDNYNLAPELQKELNHLRFMLNEFDDEGKSHEEIMSDPEWIKIQRKSSSILPIFKKEIRYR